MIKKILILLVCAISAENDTAEAPIEEKEPIDLTPDDFDSKVVNWDKLTLHSDMPWLIKFYAPWCPHCKAMAPAWKQIYNSPELTAKANVAKIDCDGDAKYLCLQLHIPAYPTILYFGTDGSVTKVEDPIDVSNMLSLLE